MFHLKQHTYMQVEMRDKFNNIDKHKIIYLYTYRNLFYNIRNIYLLPPKRGRHNLRQRMNKRKSENLYP